jgi:hypothetical protein
MEGIKMTLEILGILVIILLVLPLFSRASKFEMIQRRQELRRSMEKMQRKYTH